MGTPPMQYVTLRRIAHAKQLLQETDLTSQENDKKKGEKDGQSL